MKKLRAFLVLCLFTSLISSCQQEKKEKQLLPKKLVAEKFQPVPLDSLSIDKFLSEKPEFAEFANDFRQFYKANDYKYAWYGEQGMIEFAHLLAGYLAHEDKDGLHAKVPYWDEFRELIHYDDSDGKGIDNLEHPDITTELMLTGEYFFYAKNSWAGEVKVDGWYLPRKELSYSNLLLKNLKSGSLADAEKESVIPQYIWLKKALNDYRHRLRDLEKETEVAEIGKSSLKRNDSSEVVVSVRKRLKELGYETTSDSSAVFDENLEETVNRFRKNHGLTPNGSISQSVIAQLNISIADRIDQMIVNLERFRWMPNENHPDEYILVNIPDYRLHYYENDKETWGCNVVVGKVMNQTVIFNGSMSYLVFSPYWNIPKSIVDKEILPGIAKNPNYLAQHNMEKVNGLYRQKPGPKNSLGQVKFMFPNSNNIYLHDTPAKSLFSQDMRSFSHGCVRVAEPQKLAEILLRNDKAWTPSKIKAAMNSGKEKHVVLKKKIPVIIGYFTAFVGADGELNFRPDIYHKDAQMLAMLKD